ncbi:MAG: cytochrome C [Verrucomicrobia bacterium]|nr:cytochrome C [Verrucomicrobiota bacterium]
MRTVKIIALAATFAVAGLKITSAAGIVGTPHDLSGKGWGTTETCKFCHTPHFAQAVTGAPLWNHATTAASYTPYSSQTFKGQNQTQPSAQSQLCLSCHDGTVAVDSFANAGVMRSGSQFITSTNLIGGGTPHSLATDHPISFTYDSALATADGALVTPASTNYVDTASATGIPLFGGKMECASCHEPHDNSKNTSGKFLRVDNASSALCRKCHNK